MEAGANGAQLPVKLAFNISLDFVTTLSLRMGEMLAKVDQSNLWNLSRMIIAKGIIHKVNTKFFLKLFLFAWQLDFL